MSKDREETNPPAPTQDEIDRIAEAEEAAGAVDQQTIGSSKAGGRSEDTNG